MRNHTATPVAPSTPAINPSRNIEWRIGVPSLKRRCNSYTSDIRIRQSSVLLEPVARDPGHDPIRQVT